MNERTFPARDAHKLEDPERLTWLPPDEILSRIGSVSGMTVADIGTGTGYFALPFARAVGTGGNVMAVDFQKEMLEKLRLKLSMPGAPQNVILVEGEAARTTLENKCCDLVFMSNLWHELDDAAGVLAEVNRIVRPGGRLSIVDYRADVAPPPGPPASHRVSRDTLVQILSEHGWSVTFANNVGTYSYLLIAGPPAA